MNNTDPQQSFDALVSLAEAWFRADAYSADERALEAQIDEARSCDPGVAEAAVEVAWRKLAPGLGWVA